MDRLDAQLLLSHATGLSRTQLMAQGERLLTPEQAHQASSLLSRRAGGVPLAYLVGRREFHGLMLHITPDVLDPRPDTETLADWAIDRLSARQAAGWALDLGTGSGAIALAMKAAHPGWTVHATDASASALEVARLNAQALGLDLHFHLGPWWAPLGGQRFDVVASNPPYIAEDDPHLKALRHEPLGALVSGPDGLQDLRAIISEAPRHLQPDGWLLLEHGHEQGPSVAALMHAAGFIEVAHRRDLAGHTRCTGGRLAG